jgi:hypothetical protein
LEDQAAEGLRSWTTQQPDIATTAQRACIAVNTYKGMPAWSSAARVGHGYTLDMANDRARCAGND